MKKCLMYIVCASMALAVMAGVPPVERTQMNAPAGVPANPEFDLGNVRIITVEAYSVLWDETTDAYVVDSTPQEMGWRAEIDTDDEDCLKGFNGFYGDFNIPAVADRADGRVHFETGVCLDAYEESVTSGRYEYETISYIYAVPEEWLLDECADFFTDIFGTMAEDGTYHFDGGFAFFIEVVTNQKSLISSTLVSSDTAWLVSPVFRNINVRIPNGVHSYNLVAEYIQVDLHLEEQLLPFDHVGNGLVPRPIRPGGQAPGDLGNPSTTLTGFHISQDFDRVSMDGRTLGPNGLVPRPIRPGKPGEEGSVMGNISPSHGNTVMSTAQTVPTAPLRPGDNGILRREDIDKRSGIVPRPCRPGMIPRPIPHGKLGEEGTIKDDVTPSHGNTTMSTALTVPTAPLRPNDNGILRREDIDKRPLDINGLVPRGPGKPKNPDKMGDLYGSSTNDVALTQSVQPSGGCGVMDRVTVFELLDQGMGLVPRPVRPGKPRDGYIVSPELAAKIHGVVYPSDGFNGVISSSAIVQMNVPVYIIQSPEDNSIRVYNLYGNGFVCNVFNFGSQCLMFPVQVIGYDYESDQTVFNCSTDMTELVKPGNQCDMTASQISWGATIPYVLGTELDYYYLSSMLSFTDGSQFVVPVFISGDVNGDGGRDIADVTTLIDCMIAGSTGGEGMPANVGAADVNNDQNLNIADVTALIDMMLGGN